MLEVQPKDSRGYLMLPQAPEDAGYYVYGTPDQGGGQYAHPVMMTLLFFIEREWQAIDRRKFGIGNISLPGGGKFKPHDSHKDGLQVDVRPLRKDGACVPVSYFQAGYDREATERLIGLFQAHPAVIKVYFNDLSIPGVLPLKNHDNRACQIFCVERGHEIIPKGLFHDRSDDHQEAQETESCVPVPG